MTFEEYWNNYGELHASFCNGNIEDFAKFGWNKKVADLLGFSYTHVTRFMKKYMIDFYTEKCYHRS
jgi:hypothetical protein